MKKFVTVLTILCSCLSASFAQNDVITYTTTNGAKINPQNYNFGGANIVSNTYTDGVGTIKFDKDLTTLGNSCFAYSYRLESITLPNSVTELGSNVFAGCSSLTSVTLPNNITYLSDECFYYCSSLTGISIPESVESLGRNCFADCSALTSFSFPTNLTAIGDGCFSDCRSLTAINVPDKVKALGDDVFAYCTALGNVKIPNGVTSLGDRCFFNCNKLAEVSIPTTVESIGERCFSGCASIVNLTIPTIKPSWGEYCFSNCTNLAKVNVSAGTTSISKGSFSNCSKLSFVSIPSSVESFDLFCFAGCHSLSSLDIDASNNSFISTDGVVFNKDMTTLVLYPAGKEGAEYDIPETVNTLADGCFASNVNLTDINIPANIASIGENCFAGCHGLAGITVDSKNKTFVAPDSVLYSKDYNRLIIYPAAKDTSSYIVNDNTIAIDAYAFEANAKIDSVTFPNSLMSIGENSFAGCSNLSYVKACVVTPPTAGTNAFYGISRSAELYVPANAKDRYKQAAEWCNFSTITEDEDMVFNNFIEYTSVSGNIVYPYTSNFGDNEIISNTYNDGKGRIEFGRNLTTIGDSCFFDCDDLLTITIPTSVTKLGTRCFSSCDNIERIEIPANVSSMYGSCFNDCKKLLNIKINEDNKWFVSVNGIVFNKEKTKIVAYPSGKPENLYYVPEGVTEIGANCFEQAVNLNDVYLPSTTQTIGSSAFFKCTGLNKMHCAALTPPAVANSYVFKYLPESTELFVPNGTSYSYSTADYWKEFSSIVNDASLGSLPEITLWNGWETISAYDTYVLSDGGTELSNANAKEGDVIRFYFTRLNDNNNYIYAQIWEGHLKIQYYKFDFTLENWEYDYSVDITVTADMLSYAYTPQDWGGTFAIFGGNLAIKMISLIPSDYIFSKSREDNTDATLPGATSIQTVATQETDATIFTIDGKRINGNGLKPGVYVKGGKKFIVK